MTLVNTEVIDAELVEDEPIILFLLGQQVLPPLLAPGFLLLQIFDDVAVRAGRLGGRAVAQELVVRGDLIPQKPFLVRLGHADTLEGTVGGDDAVPRATGDPGGEELAALAR